MADPPSELMAILAKNLTETLSPNREIRKKAEDELFNAEAKAADFGTQLLQLIASDFDLQIRFAASLFLKNYVKRNWNKEYDEEGTVPLNVRRDIKAQIVNVLMGVPERLQLPLSDAIAIIADSDFPDEWEDLIDQLVNKLSEDDFVRNNAVLDTMHTIGKKWRYEFSSNALYTAINHVLDRFCAPYFHLLVTTDRLLEQHASNKQTQEALLNTFLLLSKLFYDLNCQDLPPFFEDHLTEVMTLFHKYLLYANPLAETEDAEHAGPLEKIKTSICEAVTLFTLKYEDVFTTLPVFVQTIWRLLTTTGLEPKYDILVSKAMAFLTTVVKKEKLRDQFAARETLTQLCEMVVLPNMSLRSVDEELFEDDPMEFIRRDLEGSDSETRRRSATDLVRGMMVLFGGDVTQIIVGYITQYLQRYEQNPVSHWKDKDTAIYLLTSIAAQGEVTKLGVTSVNQLVSVVDFFSKNVLPDLQTPVNTEPAVLKVDAIKYVYTFRNQMTKEQLIQVFPLLATHLESPNYVVHTYSAISIERILFMRKAGGGMMFTQADVGPVAQSLLHALFHLIESARTPETLAANDYLMKAVMRVIFSTREDVRPYVGDVTNHLTKILVEISKNPSNPRFNHYTFESIGAVVRFGFEPADPALASLESALVPVFEQILTFDVAEFVPYVYQVMAVLLECYAGKTLSNVYRELLPNVLSPVRWTVQGNIPALVRLLEAYLYSAADSIVANGQLGPILGIYQKLIASKLNDHLALQLCQAVLEYIPAKTLNEYISAILSLMLTRLQNVKNDKFSHGFVKLFCFFVGLEKADAGPDYAIQAFDFVQQRLFYEIMNGPVLRDLQKIQGKTERKVCAVGLTRLLTKSEIMINRDPYILMWPQVLVALVKFFEAPTEIERQGEALEEEDIYEFDIVEERAFQPQFAKLSSTSRTKRDPFETVADSKAHLARSLAALHTQYPEKIVEILQSKVPNEVTQFIGQYMTDAGLPPIV